jgi:hypothetical protein
MNAKQVLKETVFGNPTRFSNNYEACYLAFATPFLFHSPSPQYGEENVVDAWGVTNSFPIGTPGPFPVHTPEKVVIKDFADWEKYVKFPSLDFPEQEWEMLIKAYEQMPTDKAYCAAFVAPGIFERLHHLGGIDNTLIALYEEEDKVHDLIKKVTEWEMKMAEDICTKIHPNAVFHHDDWGSMNSTFMSVGMFEDFFLESYKEIYKYYHDHGCELVFHHSDSYAATLVPDMIEMGIDVFQGATSTNNILELVKKYGDKITIMGGFDGAMVDKGGMTKESIKKIVYDYLDEVGTPKGFIPCIAQGGPGSVYKNVYEYLWESIDEYNIEKMGATQEEINDRAPAQILFPGTVE